MPFAALFRTALPWITSILGGWVLSDVVEKKKAGSLPENMTPEQYLQVIKASTRAPWFKIVLIGGSAVALLTAFVMKKFKN
jgi:hypothetical protein